MKSFIVSAFMISIHLSSLFLCIDGFVTPAITCSRKRVVISQVGVAAKNNKQNHISNESSPYVPSGMTLEEYQSLKRKEELEESKKNYGAWGPRFARTARPEGDWMVLSRLWTHGAVDGPDSSQAPSTGKGRRLKENFVHYLPALVLSVVLMDSFLTAVTLYRSAAELTLPKLLLRGLRLRFLKWNVAKWSLAFCKTHCIKMLAALVATPIIDKHYLTKVNRHKLWSKRKTVIVSAAGSMGLLGIWALLLVGLRKAGVFC